MLAPGCHSFNPILQSEQLEHRLTEHEANDEIRVLLQNFVIQLQAFKDRIPARGAAMTTIGILLENCKPITNPLPSTTLKPPTLAGSSLAIGKTIFTANNAMADGGIGGGVHSMNGGSNIKQCVDKSTNTNTTMITPSTIKNGGFDHFQLTTMVQRSNGSVTQISITDEPITATIDPNDIQKIEPNESKASRASSDDNNQTMNDVTNRDLEFFSLKLQCMCSGSEEDSNSPPLERNDGIEEMKPNDVGGVAAAADGDETATMADVMSCGDDGDGNDIGHQCSHCGRNHCCFYLHCCYCKKHGTLDSYIHPSNSNCNNTSNRNVLASERCNEICKKRQLNNQTTTTTNTNIINKCECRTKLLTNRKCCDNDSDTKCHCRWYCIQDCDAGKNRLNVQNLEICGASNQYEDPIRSMSNNAMDQSQLDENRLKCCRCAKELF